MDNQNNLNLGQPIRKLTENQAEHYQQMLKEFQSKYNNQDFDNSTQSEYYIVSVKFINSWRDFCMNSNEERQIPIVMNQDIIHTETKRLKSNLREKEDFQVISKSLYECFVEFSINEIKRKSIMVGHQKRVPVYLNTYQYLSITNNNLRQIDRNVVKRVDLSFKSVEESQNATVAELIKNIMKKQEIQLEYEGRLWRIGKTQNLDSLYIYLKKAADKATYEYKIKGIGKKLQSQIKIEDLQLEEGDFFVLELKEKLKRWFLQAENEKKCEGCYQYCQLKFPCSCQKVAYCTLQCKEKDKKYHIRNCQFAQMEEMNKPIDMAFTPRSKKGVVGLRNLGNTCFMNSCLQCLSHTLPLSTYFIHRLYENQINRKNPLGTKGRLVKNYASFIKGMWCEEQSVFTPDSIKSAVSSINHIFSGYAQHDSQEFFSFLIDGIHEDLNRIQKKPYVQSIQSSSRPDKQVALQSWLAHIQRNQSIVTDIMTGQYKSKVTCPSCQKESITFDPFITVTLPIPQKIVNNFQCFILYKNFQQKSKKVNFSYSKPNVNDWKISIEKIGQLKPNTFVIYLVSLYEGIYQAGRQSMTEIVHKMQNENKNIFVFQLSEDQIGIQETVEFTSRFCKKGYYSSSDYENIWFKFPLFFEKGTATGLTIVKRILKMLFIQAYTKGKSQTIEQEEKENDYPSYQAKMLEKRPFNLFLKYKKQIDKHYSRLQYKYAEEFQLKDETTMLQMLEIINGNEYELDIRFNKEGTEDFNIKNLKDFDDETRKVKSSYHEESSSIELKDCFANLSQSENLEKGNEWYCPNCKEHKLATKEMSIYKAPKILILHLKRFKQKNSYRKEKNESKVLFPLTLNMKPYLHDDTPMFNYLDEAKKRNIFLPPKYSSNYEITCSQEPLYDLYAISNHYGGLGGGHYTAYAKNNERWYDFNDSSVRQTSKQAIVSSGAYMLFYQRRD